VARNIAAAGDAVLYVAYEHPDDDVLARLLAMEAGLLAGFESFRLTGLHQALQAEEPTRGGLSERLSFLGEGYQAVNALASYGERFDVVGASGEPVDIDTLTSMVLAAEQPPVVFVDYLQKVSTPVGHRDEGEQVTVVVEALKVEFQTHFERGHSSRSAVRSWRI
jgi:hypothetical protein